MRDAVVHEALRQIEGIVAESVGGTLPQALRERLRQVLQSAVGHLADARRQNLLTRDVTILLADLRGFTAICNAYPASTVLTLLNECFTRMSEVIFRHHGTIDKFMGDAILVLFESPGDPAEGVRRAIACAVDMQNVMHELNESHRDVDQPEMYFGIGINTGRVLSALLGSDVYSEYAVIGDEVNLASRIQTFSVRGQVLISESTYDHARDFVKTGEPMDVFVKGRGKVVALREVLSIPSTGRTVPRQDHRRSPRAEVKMPFTYRMVVGGVVVPESREGMILDIGYHGVLVEIAPAPSPLSEVQLEFGLPLVGTRIQALYGRVVKVTRADETWRAGIEFSSLSNEQKGAIQLFVQLLLQGAEDRN